MNSILKKSLSFIMVFCLMFLCLGLSVRVNAAGEVLVKEVDFTTKSASHSAYTDTWSYNEWTVSGGANNNAAWEYIKLGGKSENLTKYKDIYVASPIVTKAASKVTVNIIAGTLSSNKMVVNSWGLYVYSDKTMEDEDQIDYVAGETISKSAKLFTFTPSNGTQWPENSYYKVKFDLSNSTTTNGIIWLDNISVYEQNTGEPSITISTLLNNCLVNDTIQVTAKATNIDDPVITWSSSNEDVATVDNGVVTGLSKGTTTIKASVGNVESDPITITVWPDNKEVITIAEALEICEFTGTSNTPFKYSVIAEVTNKDGNNVTLEDATGTIIAYRLENVSDVSIGDIVKVTGNLLNYNSNTKEFASGCTAVDVYTVEFNSNGGSLVENKNVEAGAKISAPVEPTKENYTFVGWYNGNEEWNFETNTVTGDVTLTAKWVLSSLDTILSQVNNYNSYMSIAYKYTSGEGIVNDTLKLSTTAVSGNSYVEWSGKSALSKAVYAGQSAGSHSAIQLRDTSPSGIITTVSGGYAKKVTVEWNSNTTEGRTLDVYGYNTAFKSPTELYGTIKATKIGSIVKGTSTELEITGDYQYIGLRSNSKAMYLDSITIGWSSIAYTNDEFRIRMGIDKGLSELISELDGAKYGIEVSDGTNSKKYYSTDELYKVENGAEGKEYVVINLGEFLQNRERITTEFTVRAFVEYDGGFYYSESTKTHSIITLVEKYIGLGYHEVEGLKATLENLGYSFE